MSDEFETQNRIILAALELFLSQGIKKTNVDEVAVQAGVTRVTVYRHFGNKKKLVEAAFLHIISAFQNVQTSIAQTQELDVEKCLDSIEAGLAALPQGDLPTSLDELKRLYPDIFSKFHETRVAVDKAIFDHLFEVGRQQGLLREGLNQNIVRVFFMEFVVNLVESPQLVALNMSPVEIYANVKSIFLHGILKENKK